MGHIGKLLWGNAQLLRKDFPVAGCLVEHIHKIGVLKDVLHLTGGKQVLDVLGNACRYPAPFTEPFPNLNGIACGLFLFEQE